eukprot:TRINITY_DN5780_c1_g2_i3.p1 TRINITY_DN5780_c1_g2~~TRINITY_DN5780_c1_g2_i3.p1  ORF type:complete len:185 (-),score=46.55 TRINITY_DN5780_c1_g2_i3:81-635(-)
MATIENKTLLKKLFIKQVKKGNKEEVKKILNQNPTLTNEGLPLYSAAESGHIEVCRLLIKKGADLNNGIIKEFSFSPLYIAAKNGHIEVCRLLIEKGADINKGYYPHFTPLYFAAKNGHIKICRLLVEKGANISRKLPLYLAAEKCFIKIFRLLILNGSVLEASTKIVFQRFPFYKAALICNFQ